jgi:hypothetical protein
LYTGISTLFDGRLLQLTAGREWCVCHGTGVHDSQHCELLQLRNNESTQQLENRVLPMMVAPPNAINRPQLLGSPSKQQRESSSRGSSRSQQQGRDGCSKDPRRKAIAAAIEEADRRHHGEAGGTEVLPAAVPTAVPAAGLLCSTAVWAWPWV